jgi:hypothetical protein
VLPGDATTAWKDPVVEAGPEGWRMWACRHEIVPPEEADRMDSWYATSTDGVAWHFHGPALRPTPGTWDQRGVRIAAVIRDGPAAGPGSGGQWTALYDGRGSAEENWHERTGVATGPGPARLAPVGAAPVISAGSLRYACPLRLPDGSWLVYYEAARPDGAHDLRVEKVPRSNGDSQSS